MTAGDEARLASHARHVFAAAVRAVQAPSLLEGVDLEALAGRPLAEFQRIIVVGAGKASMALAGALEARLSSLVERVVGEVVVPVGYGATFPEDLPPPRRISVAEAGHPVPTAASAAGARRALRLAGAAGPDDLVIAVISGGGSALWALPPASVPLGDVQETTRLLLTSGTEITGINAVRRQLSKIAGGQLAVAAAPATTVALVLSDVVGDDLAAVASGPTFPDPTTAADARVVLDRAGLTDRVPQSVRAFLAADRRPAMQCTARTILLGSNRTALEASRREAGRLGYAVASVTGEITGEAQDIGHRLVREVLAAEVRRPTAWLWGGETTVTVTGTGRGGRNQEVALAAALALEGAVVPAVVLSGGTDGVDGPTDAAGGWSSPRTAGRIREGGFDPLHGLANNDAYQALSLAGGLVRVGITHTNVADVGVALFGK